MSKTSTIMDQINFKEEAAVLIDKLYARDMLILLGVDDADEWLRKMSMMDGSTKRNTTNRPFKKVLGERYASDMLRKKWPYNGESMVFDKNGNTVSAQHRAYGLIRAEKLRKLNPEKYPQWKGEVYIKALIATGIDPKDSDSTDQGAPRAHGDVLFRRGIFDKYVNSDKTEQFNLADKKKLARDLATAIRTVWLRVGGKDVSDAPHFPKSEMLDFLEKHPKIVDCVAYVYEEDDRQIKSICSTVTRSYMAAVMYLAATSGTDRDDYDATGDVDTSCMQVAEDFVASYGSGAGLEAGDPILALKNAFQKQIASGKTRDRDEILNLLVKAFTLFIDQKEADGKILTIGKDEAQPRLGGLDTVVESPEDDDDEEAEEKPKKTVKKATKKAVKKTVKKATKKAVKKPKTLLDDVDVDSDDDMDDDSDE